MVKEFLKKYQDELIEEKIELKEKIDFISIKLKEEKKFLEVLDSSNENVFSDFSPRNLNSKNKDKIEETKNQIDKIELELAEALKKKEFIDERLASMNQMIAEVSVLKDEGVDQNLQSDNKIDTNIDINSSVNNIADNNDIVEILEDIKSILYLDQTKAEKEIDNLINLIKNN